MNKAFRAFRSMGLRPAFDPAAPAPSVPPRLAGDWIFHGLVFEVVGWRKRVVGCFTSRERAHACAAEKRGRIVRTLAEYRQAKRFWHQMRVIVEAA